MPKIFGSWQSFRQIRLCIAPSKGHARASPEPAFSLTHHVSVIELTTSSATFPIHRQTIDRSSLARIVADCRYIRPRHNTFLILRLLSLHTVSQLSTLSYASDQQMQGCFTMACRRSQSQWGIAPSIYSCPQRHSTRQSAMCSVS
ncbi:hypothetical protein HBI56_023930 [Parastagonospora nodorum]|uniref:Uncharacterized protein n=1 Tax=Phaeosphaeria nodorum (strain SN15 / ATCC MYA-4574 / FGSC 10173) TaxID=321614 RepID=A0A7U2F6Y4_PHANO|nr:hypothetical protein HBH56_024590 [Parastagonospora nodorum]QRC98808.1 hypothetical protein JI435_436370 [Parastagonospora nodorum SN15]KAH3934687.1 hypothetical protein HBH54_057430 [Parastagonospora nodorum]KAH3949686.1 hypothetical protein HBH53_085120 [Parastagonospora nodorum]KAH3976156.1 hypothetical protein HBH51_080250 [Parastagonospora nodorum]